METEGVCSVFFPLFGVTSAVMALNQSKYVVIFLFSFYGVWWKGTGWWCGCECAFVHVAQDMNMLSSCTRNSGYDSREKL